MVEQKVTNNAEIKDEAKIDILQNINQVRLYLLELGFKVNHYRVEKAIERRELPARRGGGYTKRAAETWANAYLLRGIDAAKEHDVPSGEKAVDSVSEQKALAQTRMLEAQAERQEMELKRQKGLYTETAVVHTELAARAKAFKICLERWAIENADKVAQDFGGSANTAEELVQRLGIEPENAAEAKIYIQDFYMSKTPQFTRRFMKEIAYFLDAFATGKWWTDEMQDAWEKFEEGQGL